MDTDETTNEFNNLAKRNQQLQQDVCKNNILQKRLLRFRKHRSLSDPPDTASKTLALDRRTFPVLKMPSLPVLSDQQGDAAGQPMSTDEESSGGSAEAINKMPPPPPTTTSSEVSVITSVRSSLPPHIRTSMEIPSPYESEDEDGMMLAPSAPPCSPPPPGHFDAIPGYEQASFVEANLVVPPPNLQPIVTAAPPDREQMMKYKPLTEQQARDAILDFTFTHRYYSKMAARHMDIKDIIPSNSFHYCLETFAEKRETSWKYEPYTGGPIDSAANGRAPEPWTIAVESPDFFREGQVLVEVPHTASIRPCHDCNTTGRIRCSKCSGTGKVVCTYCIGREQCPHCRKTEQISCRRCHGITVVKCKTCNGRGQIKCFIQLTISWVNHRNDYVYNRTDLPDDLVTKVSGDCVVLESYPRIWPITNFIEKSINNASQSLVEKHSQFATTEKILLQRHQIRIIPVGQVFYSWKHKSRCFYVYGAERRVYAPGYPQKCCIL